MGRFDELIEQAKNPGEGGIPDSIYDDLRTAYGDEMAIAVQDREGHTTQIQELEARVSQLQTQLYDATMASGTEPEPGGDPDPDPDDDDDDEESEGIDGLFGDK